METLVRWVWGALLMLLTLVSGVSAWANINQTERPEAVLQIIPWHPGALLEQAESARAQDLPPDNVAALGRQISRMAPLSEAPLVYVGFAKAAAGDLVAADQLFAAAVERQPRNVPALSWLASQAMRAGQYSRVAELLGQLARVDPANKDTYAEALASIVAHPEGARAFDDELAGGSALALSAAGKLIPVSDDIDFLMHTAAQAPEFQQRVIDRIATELGWESAFVAWLSFLPAAELQGLSWPYDPAFVGSQAPTPFNWQVMTDAELLMEGGLLVRYTGRGNPTFVRQAMLLGPGTYRFAAEMDGEVSEAGGSLAWRVRCLPSDEEVAVVGISNLGRTLSKQSSSFTLPSSGCPVQMLSLEGVPGALTTRARATVRRVVIAHIETGDP